VTSSESNYAAFLSEAVIHSGTTILGMEPGGSNPFASATTAVWRGRASSDELRNRRIIAAFFARSFTLATRPASPLLGLRLPKHARCQAAPRPADV
jgi:hypothetical protein